MASAGLSAALSNSGSFTIRALRGAAWRIGFFGLSQILRLATNLVLAHLLFPEVFGLMALIHILIQGLSMFSDVGIRPGIVQNSRGNEIDFLNTAWTIQVLRGFTIWIVASLCAWWFAGLYEQPALEQLIPVAALVAVFQGFESTAIATAHRNLNLGRLTILEFISSVSAVVVTVLLAFWLRDVWALVLGLLLGANVKMVLSHIWLAQHSNGFRWDRDDVSALIRFGKWIFVSTALTFIASRADRLLLGKLVSIEMLGVYAIGAMLAGLPKQTVTKLTSEILFPALSIQVRTEKKLLKNKLERARRIILPAAIILVAGVTLFASEFFRILYDERYHAAGWMAQLLGLSTWLSILTDSSRRVLVAIGRTWPQAAANAVDLALTLIGCMVGFKWFGVPGLIMGYAVGTLGQFLIIQMELARSGLLVLKQDAWYSLVLAGFLAVGGINWVSVASGECIFGQPFGSFLPLSVLSFSTCGIWAIREILRNLGDPQNPVRKI